MRSGAAYDKHGAAVRAQLEAPSACLQRVAYQGAPGAHGESAALQVSRPGRTALTL